MLRVESYAVAKHIDWTTLYNWIKCVTHVVAQPVTYVAAYSINKSSRNSRVGEVQVPAAIRVQPADLG